MTGIRDNIQNMSDDEILTVFEIARMGLRDAEVFDECIETFDISDDKLSALRDKIFSINIS